MAEGEPQLELVWKAVVQDNPLLPEEEEEEEDTGPVLLHLEAELLR